MREPKTINRPGLLLTALAVLIITTVVRAEEYHVNRDAENMVKFISDAPIEDFEGVTDRIDGYVLWDGLGLGEKGDYPGSELYFEVELNGLDTGIGLRNRHMRENYLETDRYPFTHFSGEIKSVTEISNQSYQVQSEGRLFIHGVEQPYSMMATVTGDGKAYRVQSEFEVNLTDFDIEVPSLMFLKIDETIQLKLDFYLKKVE